jgi:hypothetical protein
MKTSAESRTLPLWEGEVAQEDPVQQMKKKRRAARKKLMNMTLS